MGFTFLLLSLLYGFPLRNNFHDVCLICICNMQNTVGVHVSKRTLTFKISSSDLHKTGIRIQIQRGDGSLPPEIVV